MLMRNRSGTMGGHNRNTMFYRERMAICPYLIIIQRRCGGCRFLIDREQYFRRHPLFTATYRCVFYVMMNTMWRESHSKHFSETDLRCPLVTWRMTFPSFEFHHKKTFWLQSKNSWNRDVTAWYVPRALARFSSPPFYWCVNATFWNTVLWRANGKVG